MSKLKYHEKITDDITDAGDIVKNAIRSITAGHAEKQSLLMSLQSALKKIGSAKYYIDRG